MYSFKQYSKDSNYFRMIEGKKPRWFVVKVFRYPFVFLVVSYFKSIQVDPLSHSNKSNRKQVVQKYNHEGQKTYQYIKEEK